ncbi:MAG: hypothetical protein SGPRY_014989, partial [Prymnesium sp.]
VMLPSLVKTVRITPMVRGRKIELWVYIAWDMGDAFFDSPGWPAHTPMSSFPTIRASNNQKY